MIPSFRLGLEQLPGLNTPLLSTHTSQRGMYKLCTFASDPVGPPVVGEQVGRVRSSHDQMLHVPPGQVFTGTSEYGRHGRTHSGTHMLGLFKNRGAGSRSNRTKASSASCSQPAAGQLIKYRIQTQKNLPELQLNPQSTCV